MAGLAHLDSLVISPADLVLCHAPNPILILTASKEATEQPAHFEVISLH